MAKTTANMLLLRRGKRGWIDPVNKRNAARVVQRGSESKPAWSWYNHETHVLKFVRLKASYLVRF